MAAQFCNITINQMDSFLTGMGFKRINLPGTIEAVYGKRVDQGRWALSLRVYTGISGNNSREVGEDAIRVNLFLRKPDGTIAKIGGSKRVHRVQNWQKNLKSRIDNWTDYLPQQSCPKCGLPMIPREGRNGKFLSCSGYPSCKSSRSI